MRRLYDWQTAGNGGEVSLLVEMVERREMLWCMIGGPAVNHWACELMATADGDVETGWKNDRIGYSFNRV